MRVPAVYLLPLIFRGHAEALVPLLPAELASREASQRQTPLVILVRAAVVVGVQRPETPIELSAAEFEAERPAFIETSAGPAGLRTSRWKYMLRFGWLGHGESLFDLRADPGERDDVAARHREFNFSESS